MTNEERDLITGLFQRLRGVNAGPVDTEAETLIQQQMSALPQAGYYLVQTLLVQEHALQNAQARIAQLERQAAAQSAPAQAQGGGSFLSGLLHRNAPASQAAPAPQPVPYPTTAAMSPSGGGGFLKGALTTAAGVAGGSLLFQGIEDLLGHRAGGFGSFLGGGVGGGMGGGTEIVNNYYGDAPAGGSDPYLQAGGSDFAPADLGQQGLEQGVDTGTDASLGADDPGLGGDLGSFDDNGGGGDLGGGGDMAV